MKRYSKHSTDLADVPEDELVGNESSRKKSKNRVIYWTFNYERRNLRFCC